MSQAELASLLDITINLCVYFCANRNAFLQSEDMGHLFYTGHGPSVYEVSRCQLRIWSWVQYTRDDLPLAMAADVLLS